MARPGVREPLQARSELTRDGQALDVLHCGVDAHRKRCVTGCASNSGQTTDLSRRSCAWAFANGEAPGVISGRRLKIARQAPMGWPMVSARWKARISTTVSPGVGKHEPLQTVCDKPAGVVDEEIVAQSVQRDVDRHGAPVRCALANTELRPCGFRRFWPGP